MIHFLRTATNKTVVEATAGKDDLSVVVSIPHYSKLLLDNYERIQQCIADFSVLQELRGEYHEHPSMTRARGKHPEPPDEFVERRFREVGVRWDLYYVTD